MVTANVQPLISIVTTVYKSENYIEIFLEQMEKSVSVITENYEIIVVNDASPDRSLEKLLDYRNRHHSRIVVIDLARNAQHHKAIMTGFAYAKGRYVFLIDSDLEEQPEWIVDFWNVFQQKKNIDVVYGIQERRKGFFFERFSGAIFYKILNTVSEERMPENNVLCRMMTRQYVDNLLKFKEREMYMSGLFYLASDRQIPVVVKKKHKGISSYTFRKKITVFINAITSFSSKPLTYIFLLGVGISFISFCGILVVLFNKLFYGDVLSGWTSVVVSLWFLGGLIIMFMGVLGTYLAVIFSEIKNRPYTLVRQVYAEGDFSK